MNTAKQLYEQIMKNGPIQNHINEDQLYDIASQLNEVKSFKRFPSTKTLDLLQEMIATIQEEKTELLVINGFNNDKPLAFPPISFICAWFYNQCIEEGLKGRDLLDHHYKRVKAFLRLCKAYKHFYEQQHQPIH